MKDAKTEGISAAYSKIAREMAKFARVELPMGNPLKIALGYTADDWKALVLDPDKQDSKDWGLAVKMFRARIKERFFAPVDLLIGSQEGSTQTYGFAILAIDCLVIETLQGFREGHPKHNGKSELLFTGFLKAWPVFTESLPQDSDPAVLAMLVYTDCRCALLHSGSTDGFIVGTTGKPFAFEGNKLLKINRTALHKALKNAFESYLTDLRDPQHVPLRKNFLKKMNAICGVE